MFEYPEKGSKSGVEKDASEEGLLIPREEVGLEENLYDYKRKCDWNITLC